MNRTKRTVTTRKNGFTILQMIVTIAIIAIVTTFGVLGITTARAEFRLQNSARMFASYIEKARADSVRRHASPGAESSVETFGAGSTTYAVTMDFGSGTVETRSFPLETGLSFNTAAKKVAFDWRGRIPAAWVFQVFSTQLAKSLPVDVSGSGDITVGEQHFPDQLIPAVAIAEVTGDTISDPTAPPSGSPTPTPDPSATPTPTPTPIPTPTPTPSNGNGGDNGNGGTGNGNGNGNNPTPTPTPIPTPTPSVTPTPIPQCVATLSPSTLSLSQSVDALKTGTAVLRLTNATGVRTLSVAQEGNGNSLVTSLSLVRLDGSGYSIISVTTKNGAGNRGVFVVDVIADPACGSTQHLTVSVSN
jgi:type II secretory pathway pseudopilin PulG